MNILGFGERGVVNTLFHEIASRSDANSLLELLHGRTRFPYLGMRRFRVFEAEILLDVNFGKLGQTDAIMLVDTGSQRISIFVQVKVRNRSNRVGWTIQEEFSRFLDGPGAAGYASNLFSEIYAKARLVHGLKARGLEALQRGLNFPPSASGKTVRKLGSNPVSERAVRRLERFLDDSFYVAVIPGDPDDVASFFSAVLCDAQPEGFDEWNVKHCGYLCWSDLEEFCRENRLDRTRNAFDYNRGQLF